MADIDTLVKQLGQLTVVEAGQLAKQLEKAWGVKAEMAATAPVEAPKAENAPVTITLTGFKEGKKISVLQKIREFTGLGLLEAKNFVEALPKAVKEDIDKDEANKIKEALEAEGGEITIK